MRSSLLPRSFIRSRKFSSTRALASRAAPPVCQLCHQRAIFSPHSQTATAPSSNRRFASSSSAYPTSNHDSAPSKSSPPSTHYELFPMTLPQGPPPSGPFQIEPRTLRNEFLKLQAGAHPDRHPSSLKLRAEATSSLINEAYKTLLSPLLRAQYLLSLQGIDVANDETAKLDDSELLMEVLETREEIEGAAEEADLMDITTKNEERIKESERILEDAFKKNDLERAKEETVRLRYWINIKESIHAWEKGKPVVLVH